jgi:hypothetical protein
LFSIDTGEAPTHVVSNPNEASSQFGVLSNPISAEDDLVKLRDRRGRLEIIDKDPTGVGKTHPHGHWVTSDGPPTADPSP